MKAKWALAMVGAAVLGLAALAALRELSAPGRGAGDAAGPQAAGGSRTPRMTESEGRRPVPELRFVDGAGASRSLADFHGRFVLLNVWATWCAPCREEMPSLDRLQQALGGPDFEVVALSIDRGGVSVVESFYAELGLRALRVYVDPGAEALTKLGARGIPMTVFVDPSGRELWRVAGPARWDDPEVLARIRGYLVPRGAAVCGDVRAWAMREPARAEERGRGNRRGPRAEGAGAAGLDRRRGP